MKLSLRISAARLSILLAALASAPGCRAQADLKCPQSIEVASEVRSTHEGWQSFGREDGKPERHALRGVAFSDGHPRERAFLRPASSRESASRGERTDVYRFSGVSKDGIWMACQYRDTRQMLFRPINASTCEVTSTARPDRPIASVVCR